MHRVITVASVHRTIFKRVRLGFRAVQMALPCVLTLADELSGRGQDERFVCFIFALLFFSIFSEGCEVKGVRIVGGRGADSLDE